MLQAAARHGVSAARNLPTVGGKFAVGAADDEGTLVGVAIADRPAGGPQVGNPNWPRKSQQVYHEQKFRWEF